MRDVTAFPTQSLVTFPGAGERRNPLLSAQSRDRRSHAGQIAAVLLKGGVPERDVFASEASDTLLDLGTEGRLREALGRPRRRWSGFADQARQRAARWGREYAAFCGDRGIHQVAQVVVRPPQSLVPIDSFRLSHAKHSEQLSARLRYRRRRFANGFACDIIAAEIRSSVVDTNALDLHFHLVVRATEADLSAMRAYFQQGGWTWWDSTSESSSTGERPPGRLASYVAKGISHAFKPTPDAGLRFTASALAELYRQTRGLAMVRSVGEFRLWKSQLERDGLVVSETADGRFVKRPRREEPAVPRFRRRLMTGLASQVLRFCVHDFGDGMMRPAMLVRGQVDPSFSSIAEAYDLSAAMVAARRSSPLILENAAKPESGVRRAPSNAPTSFLQAGGGRNGSATFAVGASAWRPS